MQVCAVSACRALTVREAPGQMLDILHPHSIISILEGGTDIIPISQMSKQAQQNEVPSLEDT